MRTAERNIPDLAVARVSAVLGAFDLRHRELRVSEISRRTGLPKSTTSRLVADLVAYGLLDRTGSALRIGVRLFEFGALAARRRDLRTIALPYLTDLREATGQSVQLAVLAGTDVVHVEMLPGRDAPRMPSEVGGRLPAHACAAGKALLAFSVDAAVSLVCDRPLRTAGPRTVTAPALLRRQLARVRESGLAYENEESWAGVASVASAVLRADGRPAGAVSVSGASGGLSLRSVGPAVRAVALGISREL
ncbi:IclR family transcriptional regulator [Plantactinospora soyae]|uniref:DNA-binding IclR family transcriptional regulator n=1 Tax=Plantactinospora soyae TaxID=1544732 RepID=A0A927MA24_9ACTN|nr:IclR family transcriptional regulator [Plantactinospora soyae]MBE1489336.1 DNA-binding IclR family transcriptional regulator [Plantactinospora soyae]